MCRQYVPGVKETLVVEGNASRDLKVSMLKGPSTAAAAAAIVFFASWIYK